jgi:hypothetical protein
VSVLEINHNSEKQKAVLLYSGGLDSTIVLYLLKSLGIETIALVVRLPFLRIEEGSKNLEIIKENVKRTKAKLRIVDVFEEYLQVIKNPKYGYGTSANPCVDCRIFMLRIARKVMEEEKASFIATGDVLGERPFSQTLERFAIVEKEAGVEGLVVRPLSGKLLPETIPEKLGIIKREDLFDIKGRRRIQLEIAKKFGIEKYIPPAGGCILTEIAFGRRFKDLKKYKPDFNMKDVLLLRYGRHLRLNESCKIVLGRNEEENRKIFELADKNDVIFEVVDYKGPIGLYFGNLEEKDMKLAASIIISYSKAPKEEDFVETRFWSKNNFETRIKSKALTKDEIQKFLL